MTAAKKGREGRNWGGGYDEHVCWCLGKKKDRKPK